MACFCSSWPLWMLSSLEETVWLTHGFPCHPILLQKKDTIQVTRCLFCIIYEFHCLQPFFSLKLQIKKKKSPRHLQMVVRWSRYFRILQTGFPHKSSSRSLGQRHNTFSSSCTRTKAEKTPQKKYFVIFFGGWWGWVHQVMIQASTLRLRRRLLRGKYDAYLWDY